MKEEQIVFKDQLNHPHYSWPDSLVFLPVGGNFSGGAVHVIDERGTQRPAQWVDEGNEGNKIALVTNLLSGDVKTFKVRSGAAQNEEKCSCYEDEAGVHMQNGCLKLSVWKGQDNILFTVREAECGYEGVAEVRELGGAVSKKVRIDQTGDVFAKVVLTAVYTGGERYELTFLLALGMEFVELTERMEGFKKGSNASLTIDWIGFHPVYRNSHYRKTEWIDHYVEADGLLPIRVAPYDSWVSWWMDKAISFMDVDANSSVCVFMMQADQWNDYEYALWRSSSTLAVSFYYEKEHLQFVYPLADGCRGTGLAVFSSAKEAGLDFGGVSDGLYGQNPNSPMQPFYCEKLWFWHEFIKLDKVKDWTLRWEEDQAAFPRFFSKDEIQHNGMNLWYLGHCREAVTPGQVEKVIYELSDSINQLIRTGPVSNREFYDWAIMFDHAIPGMTACQFDDLKAVFAFCAYAFSDENYMPIQHMLAGHPNFLADARGVAAVASALFPNHPDAMEWKNTYELAMARNMKYHTRPDVRSWECRGGRWTENLGCYIFAMLHPVAQAQALLYKTYGDNVALYPYIEKVLDYLINTLSAPVDGVRRIPSIGAHSETRKANMFELMLWGDALFRYAPRLAESLWYIAKPTDPGDHERVPHTSLYSTFAGKTYPNMSGTRPELKSAKYTGYGYVMRANVHEPDEMAVELIQIDEGPNYRWGRAADGGCGSIWYYAGQRQYSAQRPEDAGDWNKGATQCCCNFGVLIGHEYVSVGRNDLTEPLYDFGFAQYARVNANEKAKPFYRFRSVMMIGNDYIIVHDSLGDQRVVGRFSWFNASNEEMPQIVQLKPGVGYIESDGGVPIDEMGLRPDTAYRGRYYDGAGDFLTLVSHRPMNSDRGVYTTVMDYGVLVELQGRTDYVFQRAAKIKYDQEGIGFQGYAGTVRVYGETRAEAAIFDGSDVKVCGFAIHLEQTPASHAGISFIFEGGRITGKVQTREAVEVTLSSELSLEGYHLHVGNMQTVQEWTNTQIRFTAPVGLTHWELSNLEAKPHTPTILQTVASSERIYVVWEPVSNAQSYQLEKSDDGGKTWRLAAQTEDFKYTLESLENGTKFHIRVRGVNGGRIGDACWDYPVYVTDKAPYPPDGLRVWKKADGYYVSWGEQWGVSGYRLYRRAYGETSFKLIYTGEKNVYEDNWPGGAGEYRVTALNGNGESLPSSTRATSANGLEEWDPKPEEAFRRYRPSHEYGYRGFDHWQSYSIGNADSYPE